MTDRVGRAAPRRGAQRYDDQWWMYLLFVLFLTFTALDFACQAQDVLYEARALHQTSRTIRHLAAGHSPLEAHGQGGKSGPRAGKLRCRGLTRSSTADGGSAAATAQPPSPPPTEAPTTVNTLANDAHVFKTYLLSSGELPYLFFVQLPSIFLPIMLEIIRSTGKVSVINYNLAVSLVMAVMLARVWAEGQVVSAFRLLILTMTKASEQLVNFMVIMLLLLMVLTEMHVLVFGVYTDSCIAAAPRSRVSLRPPPMGPRSRLRPPARPLRPRELASPRRQTNRSSRPSS